MSKMNKELEAKLWASADALRGNISSEQYMHIVIGIMFIKHMSDKYENAVEKLKVVEPKNWQKYSLDKDILAADYNVSFIIPNESSWNFIKRYATSEKIGEIIDNAFMRIEETNPELKGLFDKNYNREEIDQYKLGMVVSEFSNVDLSKMGEDIIGRTYEYFLGEFFKKQGQKGGEFYTPMSIVDLMVKIVKPTKGKLYDPTAGTGGMLVQARQNIIDNGGNADELVAYGQEYQDKTWKLSKINLLLHGFNVNNVKLGAKAADTFTNDQHAGETFDYILANPPFNVKSWGYEKLLEDPRFRELGMPPKGNANYAFLSHMIFKLNKEGRGATVLANGSLSSSGKDEYEIRKKMVDKNYIDAIIVLPDKLFYTVGIPACIWVFNKKKVNKNILMIDGSKVEGKMLSKKVRELTKDDIQAFINVYNDHSIGKNVDVKGFAKTITIDDLVTNDFSFVPGRYVDSVVEVVDKDKVKHEIKTISVELTNLLREFNTLTPKVEEAIKKALEFDKN